MIAATLAAGLLIPVFGGSVRSIGGLRFRTSWLMPVALGLQVVVTAVSALGPRIGQALHLVSYGLILSFFALNARIAGMGIVIAGAALNLAAICANAGTMPASAAALQAAGVGGSDADEFANSAAVNDAALAWLGDVFAIPERYPLANVFSVGDVLIVAGGITILYRAAGVGRRREQVAVAA